MKISLETIFKRTSVRSYSGQELSSEQTSFLDKALVQASRPGPFGNRPRFILALPGSIRSPQEYSSVEWNKGIRIGTYGLIKNPPAFILGSVASGPYAVLDYGHALEGLVLAATAIGLGTCWLGGTFNRGAIKNLLSLKDGELIPAITPVGMPAKQRSLTERTMRILAGADSRKPWDQLFFDGQLGKPLDKDQAGPWAQVLEAVRRGPSASNKQPWRLLREGQTGFCLLFAEDKIYNNALGLPVQELDLGIAMRHFELAARDCGLPGRWVGEEVLAPFTQDSAGGSLSPIAHWVV